MLRSLGTTAILLQLMMIILLIGTMLSMSMAMSTQKSRNFIPLAFDDRISIATYPIDFELVRRNVRAYFLSKYISRPSSDVPLRCQRRKLLRRTPPSSVLAYAILHSPAATSIVTATVSSNMTHSEILSSNSLGTCYIVPLLSCDAFHALSLVF